MAHILIMPKQGNTVESCIIGEWKVKEGDSVGADTPVCSVETDKAAFEIPAGSAGTVLKILYPAGDDVPVLLPIMVVGNPGENWESALPKDISHSATEAQREENKEKDISHGNTDAQIATLKKSPSSSAPQCISEMKTGILAISPRARRLAEAEAVNPADLGAGSGPDGRIIEQDVASYVSKRPPLTQAAKDELRKRIAAGFSGSTGATGTGIGGRLTADELGKTAAGAIVKGMAEDASLLADEFTETPIKGIRKLIADQMMKSHNTTAAFTLNSFTPAIKLQELRARFKESAPELGLNKITINDLVLFAVSRTLPRYAYMNVHKLGESTRTWKNVHLGMAVSTNRGLMVPVIRNADRLSLTRISSKARALAEACRNGTVSPDDLHGSTFTVSNLGNAGIESFTPVINIPEAAILGVCSITPRPAETSPGCYAILPHIGLSLTIDHSVVDGAPAAEFLKELCAVIRDIDVRLIAECA